MMDRLRHPRVWSSSIMGRGNRGEGERERRCKISDGVTSEWGEWRGGRGENRFLIKAKDVGVKGQRVLWEGITGLRLLYVSLLGHQCSSAWK